MATPSTILVDSTKDEGSSSDSVSHSRGGRACCHLRSGANIPEGTKTTEIPHVPLIDRSLDATVVMPGQGLAIRTVQKTAEVSQAVRSILPVTPQFIEAVDELEKYLTPLFSRSESSGRCHRPCSSKCDGHSSYAHSGRVRRIWPRPQECFIGFIVSQARVSEQRCCLEMTPNLSHFISSGTRPAQETLGHFLSA